MSFISRWKINLESLASIAAGRLFFAAVHVTYRCNLRCRFCDFYERPTDSEMSVQEIGDCCSKLIKLGVRCINFAGGEPYIRKDLPQIIRSVSSKAITIVNTNGVLITEKNARDSWKAGADVVNVSIDFADQEKHDYYRSQKGTWIKAWKAVETLRDTRISPRQTVSVQAIYTDENHNDLEQIIKMCKERNVTFAFNPYAPGDNHSSSFKYKADGFVEYQQELKKRYPETILISEYTIQKNAEYVSTGKVDNCCAGKYMCAISPRGEIMPCERQFDKIIGNVKNLSVAEIRSKLLSTAKELNCAKCYARERPEIEYLYEPWSWSKLKYLLSEAKT